MGITENSLVEAYNDISSWAVVARPGRLTETAYALKSKPSDKEKIQLTDLQKALKMSGQPYEGAEYEALLERADTVSLDI